MQNAPVNFEVINGDGALFISPRGLESNSLLLRTDQNGICSVYFDSPDVRDFQSAIKAMVGREKGQAIFLVHTTADTNATYNGPFQLSNCMGSVASNGDEPLTWQNNTQEAAYIEIYMRYPDGSSEILFTLPPDATSAVVPAAAWAKYSAAQNR